MSTEPPMSELGMEGARAAAASRTRHRHRLKERWRHETMSRPRCKHSREAPDRSRRALRRPIVDHNHNNIIALQNQGNKNFCVRLSKEWKTDCLNADVQTITHCAKLRFEEAVLSREIYDVNFDLSKAKIHGTKVLIMTSACSINDSSSPNTAKLTLKYTQTETRTWDSSATWKLGVETEIDAGVPCIVDGKVKVTAEFSGSYGWGSSIQETTEQEIAYEVTVPPKTKVTVTVLATQGTCDVPFSYKQDDLLYTGEKVTYELKDGLYTGVNCYNLRYETKEEKIK